MNKEFIEVKHNSSDSDCEGICLDTVSKEESYYALIEFKSTMLDISDNALTWMGPYCLGCLVGEERNWKNDPLIKDYLVGEKGSTK